MQKEKLDVKKQQLRTTHRIVEAKCENSDDINTM